MAELSWDDPGEHLFETGVDHGVLYLPDETGLYTNGVAWNGLVSITESRSGAEVTPQYADNIEYLTLMSAEKFGATIEAFTYPDAFAQCDGLGLDGDGNSIEIGQQPRKRFGLSYRTKLGNDIDGEDHGYKLHLVYGALASPTEKPYATVNDSPEPITFSWEITTTPVPVLGYQWKPTSILTITSTKASYGLETLELMLYGSDAIADPDGDGPEVGVDEIIPTLPWPHTVIDLLDFSA